MTDFEKPSLLFRIEMDYLKPFLLGPRVYRPYVDSLGLSGAERVMDYGCGNGVCLGYFARALEKGGTAVGLDSSRYMVEKAKKRLAAFQNVRIVHGDAMSSSFDPESFDLVSMVHVLHDIPRKKRSGVLAGLAKLLRYGGRMSLLEPTSPRHGIAPEEITELLSGAGFSVTKMTKEGRRVRVTAAKSGAEASLEGQQQSGALYP
ncbi:MAG: class I SAM-dependent methyltransferase [Thermovirgaceae bacterium]